MRLVADPVPSTAEEAIFAGDDRGVTHDTARVGDGCRNPGEHGCPARLRERCDEDLAVLHVRELPDVEDHSRLALSDTGRAGDAVQAHFLRRRG